MGSMISLGIDKFEIEWGKNNSFINHSSLFHHSDVSLIPYYYADNVIEMKEGFSRQLGLVSKRLDLLGYPLHLLPEIYDQHLNMMPDYYPDVPISFNQFRSIITAIDLARVDINSEDSVDCDLGEFARRCIFNDPEVRRHVPANLTVDDDLGTFFENLDPYVTLKLLAENGRNSDRMVQWRYADVVDGGWVDREEIFQDLADESKILIVTEGSSDTFIIKRSMADLRPEVADFFHFVDMEEHYPFTGTGNLFRFCQGLARIKIQNNVLVIFDNDVAGIEKYELCRELAMPKNMHICRLPDHECFENFVSIGPNGASTANINGSAVAIECFLDLKADARVRWTSYNRDMQRYQGEIEAKDEYVKIFKKANLVNGSYDTSKLQFLMDFLVDIWVKKSA